MNLLRVIRRKTKQLNEGHFGVPFRAVGPDGIWKEFDASYPIEDEVGLKTLQINYTSIRIDPNTGDDVVVANPFIAIHTECLAPFPEPGEGWIFELPESLEENAPLKMFAMSADRLLREDVLGAVVIYLMEVKQSEED